jgi:hypothetical protein
MPTDLSLEIRRAIVAHLRADASVTALVPAERIYGEWPTVTDPDWPFIRMGYSDAAAFEASGWSGSESGFTIHVFAEGPGTDAVQTIAKRVQRSMEAFEPLSVASWSEWRRTNVMPDVVAGKLHAVLMFDVTAIDVV